MKRMVLLLIVLIIGIGAGSCERNTSTGGGFVGGTEGVAIKFLTDTPPAEVYDDNQFPFEVAVQLENKGETTIEPNNLKVEISGVSKDDFGGEYKKFNEDQLIKTYRDANGAAVAGTKDYLYFSNFMYKPKVKGSSITFNLRADLCYHYNTIAVSKLCIKKQFTAPGEEAVCNVNEAKAVDVSGAPVQVTGFKELAGGPNKIAFSFEIQHKGSGAVSKHFSGGDALCLGSYNTATQMGEKLKQMNKVNVLVETGLSKPICSGLTTAGAGGNEGDVHLHEGSRVITCTQDISGEEGTYEKPVSIRLEYDYKQHVETPVTVKHVGGIE